MAKPYRLTTGTKAANAVLTALLKIGLAPGFMRLLTVKGRRTGKPHSTPVVPVQNDDGRWLVSPYGEVGWVRNARAAGEVTLRRGKDVESLGVTELAPADAAPVLRAYLTMQPAGKYVRAYFDAGPDASDAELAAEAPRHPVFALHPRDHR